ncbi:MAG: hypothetical protein ACLPVO_17455 [Desulfomonilaceae bacterium]
MGADDVGFLKESIYELPPDSSIDSSPALRDCAPDEGAEMVQSFYQG